MSVSFEVVEPEKPEYFRLGQTVYLKSGSPPLTVTNLTGRTDAIEVEWFDGAKVMRDAFLNICLTSSEP